MTMKRILKRIIPTGLMTAYHRSLSATAGFLYRNPSREMIIIGITGTKGKSTTAMLTARILEQLGETVGLTSTISFKVGKREWLNDKKMTMPGRLSLQKLLREMARAGCRYAVIETSSEGIAQYRHARIQYDMALFTNLSPEHIESHGSFENYRAAKEKLFKHLTRFPRKKLNARVIPKIIVANADDPETERILKFTADKKMTYGQTEAADIRISDMATSEAGGSFLIAGTKCSTSLLGLFNIMNAAAAITCVHALGYDLDSAARALSRIPPVPGRQELIQQGQNFRVMIDYAYEPESQKKLYELLTVFKKNRVIHVTGSAGGGRDKSRRPILGALAGKNADLVIVTNEDPYDEDPQAIIDQVAGGALAAGKVIGKNLFLIADRRTAIEKALSLAREGDFVLITGKGAEQALCVADGKKIPWDDRSVAKNILLELRSGQHKT